MRSEAMLTPTEIREAVALSVGSLAERQFLVPGVEVAGAAGHVDPRIPREDEGDWALGPVVLGPPGQAADILTRAHTSDQVRALTSGPTEAVDLLAAVAGRA
jgi:hypothetical protein